MSPPPPASIRIRDLSKRYGPVPAVTGVSFAVAPGEIFGLLGLNGAGKTTIIECLLGLRAPDAGSLSVAGIDVGRQPREALRLIGAQLQFASLQAKITPREALGLFASFHVEAAPPDELLARFALADKANAPFDSLSGGQRQRLFLALAFVNHPQVLVLDEPTAGLDPQSRRELHRLITGLKTAGRAVLLSTHYLEEAHHLCDRIGVLHDGRLVAIGTPAELVARSRALPRLSFRTSQPLEAGMIASLPGVVSHEPKGAGWLVGTREINRCIRGLVQKLDDLGGEMLDLQIHQPSLEDVFLELTGRAWSDANREGNHGP